MESKTTTLTVGERGPVLLQDFTFLDDMAHFDRERIPERVVHAKGAGLCLLGRYMDMLASYSGPSLEIKEGRAWERGHG